MPSPTLEAGELLFAPRAPAIRARRRAVAVRLRARAGALIPWLLPILLLAAWQLLTQSGLVSTRILPTLSAVAKAGYKLALSGELFEHMGISFARAMAGLVVGGGSASPSACSTASSQCPSACSIPRCRCSATSRISPLIPLVILWFGIDEEAKLFLVALGVLFPIYLNTFHGIRHVDPGLIEMARVLRPRALAPAVHAGHPARCPAVDPGRAALCAGHHVADPDRRRDDLRLARASAT